ncbi:SH3 domain-containing protein [Leptonema illini]|uniref:SH3b domain-containing protein n=1 Tax=Leptonema illini DSM 21528 TaxID=929563 RepID=H2CFM7_9LEPT|nr:SH3 domain-containing protein [Leptonema illini]EHQ05692.1 hypothetical protein Lepil_0992 [Leptonema illini DSM 21528]
MLKKSAGSIVLFILSATSLFADEQLCIAGDAVRLRAEPSTDAPVLREYYYGHRIFKAEPVSAPLVIGGKEGRWMKIENKVCALNCIDESGFLFSGFLRPCSETEEDLRRRMLDTSIPLEKRLAFRRLSILLYDADNPAPSVSARLLPGGKSGRQGFDSMTCYIGCLPTTYNWQVKGGRLIVDVETTEMDYNPPVEGDATAQKSVRFRCEYKGIEYRDYGLRLVQARAHDPRCVAIVD